MTDEKELVLELEEGEKEIALMLASQKSLLKPVSGVSQPQLKPFKRRYKVGKEDLAKMDDLDKDKDGGEEKGGLKQLLRKRAYNHERRELQLEAQKRKVLIPSGTINIASFMDKKTGTINTKQIMKTYRNGAGVLQQQQSAGGDGRTDAMVTSRDLMELVHNIPFCAPACDSPRIVIMKAVEYIQALQREVKKLGQQCMFQQGTQLKLPPIRVRVEPTANQQASSVSAEKSALP